MEKEDLSFNQAGHNLFELQMPHLKIDVLRPVRSPPGPMLGSNGVTHVRVFETIRH